MNWRQTRNAIGICVAFSVFGTPSGAADWPQFRGNAAHTAFAPAAANTILVPLWRTAFPTLTIDDRTHLPAVVSSPAVASGVVFAGSRNTRFYALDARTGTILWEHEAGSPIESSPLVHEGRVYFIPMNGQMTALSTSGGPPLWSKPTGGTQDRSSPALAGENVVAGTTFPSRDIVAFNRLTGDPGWRTTAGQFVFSSPAVGPDGSLYTGANDGRLYALKLDGSPLWPSPYAMVGSIQRASPTVADGKVYLSAGEYDWNLHAVDAATGALVWAAPMTPRPALPIERYRGIQVSSPAVDGSFVTVVGGYGRAGLGPSTLYAFRDAGTTFESLWTLDLPNSVGDGYVSSPALTPSSVIVGTADTYANASPSGRLYVVDRLSGSARWYAAAGAVLSSPAVADDLVVVGDSAGGVTAWQAVTPGDVDRDGLATVLDAQALLAPASGDGTVTSWVTDRADLAPTDTPRPDGSRSFGDSLITPADVDQVLRRAVGLAG